MLQRVQTLYITAVILLSLLLFIPSVGNFALIQSTAGNDLNILLSVTGIKGHGIETGQSQAFAALVILDILVIIFALLALLKFKQRLLQIKLCYFNILLLALLLGGMWMFTDIMKHKIMNPKTIYLSGFYLPVIQVILLFMARKAIKKDEDLVRSSDRLR